MDVEIVGLTVGVSVVFLYTCYLHWTLKRVKEEIIGMISNLEDLDIKSDVIEIVSLKKQLPSKGKVSFNTPWLKELGVFAGDIVGFGRDRDYRIKIDGKEYYRTRAEDLMYILN